MTLMVFKEALIQQEVNYYGTQVSELLVDVTHMNWFSCDSSALYTVKE